MTSIQAWSIRLLALTIIVLIAGAVNLGAQGEPTRETQATVGGSPPHPQNRYLSKQEYPEIGWTQLVAKLKTEFKGREESQPTLTTNRVPDGARKSVLFVKVLGKTATKHGLLGTPWDQRTTRRIELFELGNERYLVVQAKEQVEVRAPYGNWHLEEEQFTRFIQTPAAGQVITGNLPMGESVFR